MDETTVALTLARLRIGLGAVAFLTPGIVTRVMAGSKPQGIESAFVRMLGGRDIALGLGTIVAVDHGVPVRGWLEGGAMADAGDALAAALAGGKLLPTTRKGTIAVSGAASLLGALLSRRLDPAPPPHPGQPEAVATGHHEPPAS